MFWARLLGDGAAGIWDGVPLKALGRPWTDSMGDEMHQRNVACSSLLLARLGSGAWPALDERPWGFGRGILAFIGGNDQFFLNVAMALGKAITDPARGIDGFDHGDRHVAQWHGLRHAGQVRHGRAPGSPPRSRCREGLYFPGFTDADANP